MSRFLRVFAIFFGLIFAGNAFAAGYTCDSLKTYTSCNGGYYMNGTKCTACPSNSTTSAGNTATSCTCTSGYTVGGTPSGATTTTTTACTAIATTITLNGNGATTAGTGTIYGRYNTQMVFLDSARTTAMASGSGNTITAPSRKYTVTYNANGGTVSTTSATATYTFNGYYSAASGGTQYIATSGYPTTAGYSAAMALKVNTTWYAQWTEASVTLPTPTKAGCKFNGWSTSSTATSGTTGSYTPTSNVTLYATWTCMSISAGVKALTYNGSAQSCANVTAPTGATITYSASSGGTYDETEPTLTNFGSKTVYYKVSATGYTDFYGSYFCAMQKALSTITVKEGSTTLATGSTLSLTYPTAKSLSITCSNGATPTASGDTTAYVTVSTSGSTVTLTPAAVGNGTIVSISCPATTNYLAASASYTVNVANGTITISGGDKSKTYDGGALTCSIAVTAPTSGATIKYGTASGTYNLTSAPTITNVADSKTIYYQVTATNYTTKTGSFECTINPATITISGGGNKTLTYNGTTTSNGTAQSCANVTVSSPSGATVTYSTSSGGTYSATAPTLTNVGSTTVYYKVEKTNYTTKTGNYTCTMGSKAMTVSASNKSKVYDGSALTCSVSVSVPSSGATIKYGTVSGTYNLTSAPTQTNVGSQTVYYQVTGSNFTTKTGSFTCSVTTATGSTVLKDGSTDVTNGSGSTAFPGTKTLTATCAGGATISSVTSGTTSVATVSNSGNTITLTPKATGSSKITVNCPATTNYAASSATYTWTVNPGTITASASDKTLTYNGSAQSCGTVSVTAPSSGATIKYGTSSGSYTSSSAITKTDAGTYTIYYQVTATNYTTKTGSFTCTVDKAANTLTLSATSGSMSYSSTATFTVSKNTSGGNLSVATSNSDVATASISGTTVTITSKTGYGSADITVTSAATSNYNSASAKYTITVDLGTITLNNQSANTAGTTAIYQKYNTNVYLDSARSKGMTTSANPITIPKKSGVTFKGYYSATSGGTQYINANGYITSDGLTAGKALKANGTWYAQWSTCPAGSVCNGSSVTTCPAGSFCPEGSTSATKCPGLYVNSAAGSDANTDCYFTTTGGYYITASTDTEQTKCGNKYYCPATTLYYPNTGNRQSCPDATASSYIEKLADMDWLSTACPDATASNSSITSKINQSWGAETASDITGCKATYVVKTPCALFNIDNTMYNSTTGAYDTDKGSRYSGTLYAGYYFTERYASYYCDQPSDGTENTKPMYYRTAAKCPANSYCPGGTVPKCNTGTYNTTWGANACTSLGSFYTTSAAGATASTACYGTTTSGNFVKTANAAQETCTCGGYCLGSVTVYYGSTGGKTDCAAGKYNSATGSSASSACKTTDAGYYAAKGSCSQTAVSAGRYTAGGATTANGDGAVTAGYWNNGCGTNATGSVCSTSYSGGTIAAGRYGAAGATTAQGSGAVNAGYYSTGGGTSATPTKAGTGCISSKECGTIAAGRYGAAGATTAQGSGAVNAGYYSTGGGTSATPTAAGNGCLSGYACGKVTAGCYTTSTGSTTACPNECPGDMTSAAGSDAKTDCQITCTAGNYLAAGGSTCSTCTKGNYCANDGTYNFNASSDQGIAACSGTNQWQANTGETSCDSVTDGMYKSNNYTLQNCGNAYYCKSGARTACTTATGWSTATTSTTASAYTACYQTQTPSGCASGTIKRTASSISGTTITYGTATVSSALSANKNYYVSGTSCPVCTNLGAFYTTSAGGAISSGSCYGTTTGGKYIKTQYSSTQETCPAGSYCPATNVYYGKYGTSSGGQNLCPAGTANANTGSSASSACVTCAAGTYNTTMGNTTCSTCTANYYCTGGTNRTACSSLSGVSVSGGSYTSAAGSDASTDCKYTAPAPEVPTYCATKTSNTVTYSGTAWPTSTYSVTAKAGSIISANNTATATCSQCTGATYSAGGTATSCSSCDTNYQANTTAGKSLATQCQISCGAGQAVLEKNKACATVTGNNYKTGTALVNYGSTSPTASDKTSGWAADTIYACPSSYSISGTATTNHDARTDCTISCAKGTQVASANATCTTPSGTTWYTAAHSVSAGSTSGSNVKSCNTGYATANTTTATDHDEAADCKIGCSAGYYIPTAGGGCKVCTAGKYCSAISGIAQTSTSAVTGNVTAGYWNNGCGTNATGSVCSTSYSGGTIAAGYYGAAGATSSTGSGTVSGGYYSTGGGTSATPTSAGTGCLSSFKCGKLSAAYYSNGGSTADGATCVSGKTCGTCDSNYRANTATGKTVVTQCETQCAAGTAVLTANKACATIQNSTYKGKYTAQHNVAYGSKSSIGDCPTYYQDGNGAAGQANCINSCAAGTQVASANADCSTPNTTNWYTDAHNVTYGKTSANLSKVIACDSDYANSGTDSASHAGVTSCKVTCAAGTYVASSGAACTDVGNGYYRSGSETVSQTKTGTRNACTDLGAIYKASDAGRDADTDCYATTTAKRYVKTAKDTAETSCPAGSYCPGSVKVYYNSTGGSTLCPAGQFCVAGVSAGTACALGSYTSTTGKSACTACGSGKTTNGTGQTSCNATCGNASNVYSWASTSWSNNSVANLCKATACNQNTYYTAKTETGYQNTCTACGTYSTTSAGNTSTTCACNAGYTADGKVGGTATTTSAACKLISDIACAIGQYVPAKATSCSACTAGYYCPSTAKTYSYSTSIQGRTECSAGTYQPSTGKTSCIDASAGYYVPKTAQTGQTACTGATYQDATKQTSCKSCPTYETYSSKVLGKQYWVADGIHDTIDGCQVRMNEPVADDTGNYDGKVYCQYSSTAGDFSSCWVYQQANSCAGGYYYAAGVGNNTSGTATTLKGNVCKPVTTGYWSAADSLTRTECSTGLVTCGSGACANEADDCGRKLHMGANTIYLRSAKRGTPALNVKIGDKTFYGVLSTSLSSKAKVKNGTTTYSVVNDNQ